MAKIAAWTQMPPALRDHLAERMRDREIGLQDLNTLRIWLESAPEVPEGAWFKDFGSFQRCGRGRYPTTFLLSGQAAAGAEL